MAKKFLTERTINIIVPVLSVIFGLLVGAIVMITSGYDPIVGYAALWDGMVGNPRAIGETLRTMIPLVLAGLSVAFAFRTGLFNIGVEGQLLVGWLAAVWFGYAVSLPAFLHVPLSILFAALVGGLWGFIPGYLKGKFKVNEVIVTIMMNYIALYVTYYIIRNFLHEANEKSYDIKASASLSSSWLASLTDGSRLHWGIVVAIVVALIMWFLLDRTTLGYELKSVGFNQHASKYAGMKVSRNVVLSMTIAGAFAGIGGAMEGLGTFQSMTAMSSFTGIGFDGIAVALLGANNAFGILLSALLFGGLKSAAPQMNFEANVPSELINVIIACIIFFVACSYILRWALSRFNKEGK
ncbi:nucleoside ABC transporter membrane protein [Bacillus sp. 491mf]|uniref:ABC transporter permease n=1 Tax=unclassified Bacillus (in: firmicutes) TaxID=185979 RepID=UPI000552330F|nr:MULTISPECIES: ABC transporter permease [unclassified Bacillus (in: firmicutes)]SFB98663.1 nucleoside ABC transporter membrane protein [Bacillus sp. 491mf]